MRICTIEPHPLSHVVVKIKEVASRKRSYNQLEEKIGHCDYLHSEHHHVAMVQGRADVARTLNQPLTSYSPIPRSVLVMDEAVQWHMKKFDICYVMAKESLGFQKYPALRELEERHGVDLGFAYKSNVSAQTYTHYIAESQRQSFLESFGAVYTVSLRVSAKASSKALYCNCTTSFHEKIRSVRSCPTKTRHSVRPDLKIIMHTAIHLQSSCSTMYTLLHVYSSRDSLLRCLHNFLII